MATPTEELRLRHCESLSGCLSSQSLCGGLIPSLALESGQSQDEYLQIPGSSGQHWVLCVALIAEEESSQ